MILVTELNCEPFLLWFRSEELNEKLLLWNFVCRCPARGRLMLCSRVISRFKENSQHWSGHLIKCWFTELSRDGRENIWLRSRKGHRDLAALGPYWPQAKYFLVRPSHSVNKFKFWPYHFDTYGPYTGTFCLWFSMEMALGAIRWRKVFCVSWISLQQQTFIILVLETHWTMNFSAISNLYYFLIHKNIFYTKIGAQIC